MCVAATTLHVTAADVDSDPIRLCLVELEGGAVTMGRAQVGVQPGALVRLEFVTVDDQLLPSFALRG